MMKQKNKLIIFFKSFIPLVCMMLAACPVMRGQSFVFQKKFYITNNPNIPGLFATADTGNLIANTILGTVAIDNFNLIKLDKEGNMEWANTYGGDTVAESLNHLITTRDNGYLLQGQIFQFGSGHGDMLITKIDAAGNVQWSNAIGTPRNEFALDGFQLPGGGFAVIGGNSSTGTVQNFFFAKLDSAGNKLFCKYYGDSLYNSGISVLPALGGAFVLGGIKRNNVSPGEDFFLIKTDSIGNVLWSKTYGGSGTDTFRGFIATKDNGYLMYGYSASFTSNWSGLIIKVDSAGNYSWSKIYSTFNIDYAFEQNDGSILVGGSWSSANAYLFKIDSIGNTSSLNLYPNTSGGQFIVNTNGDISHAGKFNDSLVFNKMDSNGNACSLSVSPVSVTDVSVLQTTVITNAGDTGVSIAYNLPFTPFTPFNYFTCNLTGTEELTSAPGEIKLFPNPTNGTLNLTINTKQLAFLQCEIVNVLGESVYQTTIRNQQTIISLNVSFLPKGIYLVRVDDGKSVASKKLLVE